MKTVLLSALLALGSFGSISAKDVRFAHERRSDPAIQSRQLNPRAPVKVSLYNNILAPAPKNYTAVRRQIVSGSAISAGLPQTVRLAITKTSDGSSLGFVGSAVSTFGDYVSGAALADALQVSITTGTTAVQQLPIQNGNPTYPYLVGVVGSKNSGYDTAPFQPSSDLSNAGNNYNYAYISNGASSAYGPASIATSRDNSQRALESGMFMLGGPTLTQLLPVWVNTDGSTVQGQTFALDGSNNLLVTANPTAFANTMSGGATPVTISIV